MGMRGGLSVYRDRWTRRGGQGWWVYSSVVGWVMVVLALLAAVEGGGEPIAPVEPAGGAAAKVFLPAIGTPSYAMNEAYPVTWAGGRMEALDGRLVLDFPQGAVNYPNCVVHLETPNGQAEWLVVNFYIACQVNQGEPPYYFSQFNFPVTIQMSYAKVNLASLDEARLSIFTGYPLAQGAADQALPLGARVTPAGIPVDGMVVDTVNRVVSGKIDGPGAYYLDPGFTITDLAAGAGGVYAAAAPIVYRVQPDGSLQRYLNLDEMAAASELYRRFSRFAVNASSGEIYLPLAGKYAGSAVVIYAASGAALRSVYTIPAGEELWSLAYRPGDDILYLSMSKIDEYWFGCPIRTVWVRAVQAIDGSLVGDLPVMGIIKGLAALSVDSEGRLLGVSSDVGCFDDSGYTGATLRTAEGTTALARLNLAYEGFRGVEYLAADGAGRTYMSNRSADAISVVAGPASDVVGVMRVEKPGPLAVSGGTLYVLSKGKILTRSTGSLEAGTPKVMLTPSDNLSGSDLHIQVKGTFARIPAHNVITYNGTRYLLPGVFEHDFSGAELELTYVIVVPQPAPERYIPMDQQSGVLAFKINGVTAASQVVHAPQMPYLQADIQGNLEMTAARGQWVMFRHWGVSLSSQEGLFPARSGSQVLYQFNQTGDFHFVVTNADESTFTARVVVTPFGAPESSRATIDPAQGGVLWASGGALEIPAGALPPNPGGYEVTFGTEANRYAVQGTVEDRSLVQKFSFTPEVTGLNADVILHIPRKDTGSSPVMAFFDSALNDPFPIESRPDSSMSTHVMVTLPAGSYSLSGAQTAQPGWLRRGLNWLGSTGLWHAVGLPNGKAETDRFVILYNSNDCSETYASNLLEAMEDAYLHFQGMGFTMPAEKVYVKVAPWIAGTSTPGVTPGIGSLFNFYIFMNNALALETLQDTAVHEFMHVLQKTNATPDGRYMNPVWWEEATAIWAQYEMYPSHDGYYVTDIRAGDGESFLRTPVGSWGSLPVEKMNAIMAMAVYLQQKYGQSAVLMSFINLQADWGALVGVQKSIEQITGKPFDQFYEEFAKAYWMQTFAPVDQWTFIDNLTAPGDRELNALYPYRLTQAVNSVSIGDVPSLSSGVYKLYAGGSPLPPSFEDPLASGSVARIASTCTGMKFYFYNSARQPVEGLKFEGVSDPPFDQVLYDGRLGDLTSTSPMYLLYMDSSYNYSANCYPVVTLEQPTIDSVSPDSVLKDRTVTIVVSGGGFGSEMGQVVIGGQQVTPTYWGPTTIAFSWNSGSMPGSVTVAVTHKKGAISNRKPVTITE